MTNEEIKAFLEAEVKMHMWLVLIETKNANCSDWVKFEIERAKHYGKALYAIDAQRFTEDTVKTRQEIETDAKFRSCIHKLSKGFRIFLSHTRVDTPFADGLRNALEVAGFEVYNPESMSLGTNWILELENAIREVTDTGIFVTLISKTSLRSEYGLKELTFAQQNNGLVLPVIIEPIDKAAIPSHLQSIQWLDVSKEDSSYKMFEKILPAITRIRHDDFARTCGRIIT